MPSSKPSSAPEPPFGPERFGDEAENGNAARSAVSTSGCADTPMEGANAPARRLSLCNDVVFKILFSRQPHLLSDLINAVRHSAPPITVQRILNPHILPEELAASTSCWTSWPKTA